MSPAKTQSGQSPVTSKKNGANARRSIRKESPGIRAKRKRVAKEIWDFMEQDKFAKSLGIKLIDLREGYSRCAMVVGDEMVNAHNIAHGAAIFALADYAFATACNAHGQTALALEVKINFLQAVKPGTSLNAEAREESLSARIGLYHLTVVDASGALVAAAQATAYRKNESFI